MTTHSQRALILYRRRRFINYLLTYLLTYNSFQVIWTTIAKNRHFYVPRPSFFVCPGDAPVAITQNVAWMKKQFSACQTPRSMYLSIFNSFRVIRCLSQCVSPKIAILPHFYFPWGRPWGNHAKCCMDGKEFDAYKLSRSMYPSIFNSFPVIRTASAKNRRFDVPQPTFFVSPGDAPTIT